MTERRSPPKPRTRRTPAEMAVARAAARAANTALVVPTFVTAMSADDGPEAPVVSAAPHKEASPDQIALMRARAEERKLKAVQDEASRAAAAPVKLERWLYNSNTENISEFPEGFLIVEDGYFEYTPPANFRYTAEDKEVHLEFCRARVNTKPIDGVGNAKMIRSNAERIVAQTAFMPPQPQTMSNGALSIETSI